MLNALQHTFGRSVNILGQQATNRLQHEGVAGSMIVSTTCVMIMERKAT